MCVSARSAHKAGVQGTIDGHATHQKCDPGLESQPKATLLAAYSAASRSEGGGWNLTTNRGRNSECCPLDCRTDLPSIWAV
jgi:hypothetical protein